MLRLAISCTGLIYMISYQIILILDLVPLFFCFSNYWNIFSPDKKKFYIKTNFVQVSSSFELISPHKQVIIHIFESHWYNLYWRKKKTDVALTTKTVCSLLSIHFGVKATFVILFFSKVLQLVYMMDHVQNLFCYTYFFNHEQIY